MTKPADRRLAILSFIRHRVEAEGQAPTLAEIAEACGFASKSAVRKHVLALQESGELEAPSGKARSARPKTIRAKAASLGSTLFEIGPGDVRELSDSDLRELVSRLCVARLAAKGHPPEYVIWGGDQRAADGGIDVRVDMPESVPANAGFVRRTIGIQVKATSMPPSEIQKEMCPGGVLRSSIRDIIRAHGAYIIASSDNASDERYRERLAAMKAATSGEPGADHAAFDFYDARRLADWANQHPGVVAWVRTRLGRALHGWRPWGQWAVTRGGRTQSFVDDAVPRLIDPSDSEGKYTLVDGLRHVRALLRQGGASVRIAGLSGVGKTRFVQALFEEEAAADALAPDLAVYADSSESPSPLPQTLLDELLANNRRAILIIDNCSSQLHAHLTARCKAADGVSLLTIEYDIREDIPDETNVFRLEPGSPDLITKVIEQQFPHISQVNVSTISQFADGNSRVAIALADTLNHKDSLAGLSNDTLFERLFWQGRQVDPALRRAAEACALVYSFEGEDGDAELPHLASLADMSTLELYRQVDALLKRGLAQKRGPWRAILPHAIANTLARHALSALPYSLIESRLVAGQGRLLRSFSRRLGYLHESPEAVAIVKQWFSDGGLLGDVTSLGDPLIDILGNVAPVDPAATLHAIERAANGDRAGEFLSTQNRARTRIARLLRSIAWDPAYFDRCMALLVRLALEEPPENRNDPTASLIKSMFAIRLSGTRASEQQRANWIRVQLESTDARVQGIGIECLDAALEAYHFSSHYGFDFGARPRDYGYSPQGSKAKAWFELFVALAVEFALQPTRLGTRVRETLAASFRSLWVAAGIYDELERATAQLLPTGWEKGWLAIKQTLRFDGKGMPCTVLARLNALETRARPRTLVERTKAVVLNAFSGGLDITDGDEDGSAYERADQQAMELGQCVVVDPQSFKELLPLVVENRQGRHWMFGLGLAKDAADLAEVWASLVGAYQSTQADLRNLQVLRGFLNGTFHRDRKLFEDLLNEAMEHEALESWVPVLQLSEKLDARGCRRLLQVLENPNVPSEVYHHLSYGRVTNELEDEEISGLLRRLARLPNGLEVAIDVLSMHIYDESKQPGPHLVALGRELLAQFSPKRHGQRLDFASKLLVAKFLDGPDGEPHARAMLRKLRTGLDTYSLSPYDVDDTLEALFAVQPVAALDELLGDEDDEDSDYVPRRALQGQHRRNSLGAVPVSTLIQWCMEGRAARWYHMAASIPAFAPAAEGESLQWSEIAVALLERAPEPLRVAGVLIDRIEPMSWSGSRAEIIAARLPLLDELAAHIGPDAAPQVAIWRNQFQQLVDRERRRELEEHRSRNERFE